MKKQFTLLLAVIVLALGALVFVDSAKDHRSPHEVRAAVNYTFNGASGVQFAPEVVTANAEYSQTVNTQNTESARLSTKAQDSKILTVHIGKTERITSGAKHRDENTKTEITYKSPLLPGIFSGIGIKSFARASV